MSFVNGEGALKLLLQIYAHSLSFLSLAPDDERTLG